MLYILPPKPHNYNLNIANFTNNHLNPLPKDIYLSLQTTNQEHLANMNALNNFWTRHLPPPNQGGLQQQRDWVYRQGANNGVYRAPGGYIYNGQQIQPSRAPGPSARMPPQWGPVFKR